MLPPSPFSSFALYSKLDANCIRRWGSDLLTFGQMYLPILMVTCGMVVELFGKERAGTLIQVECWQVQRGAWVFSPALEGVGWASTRRLVALGCTFCGNH
ncbi:hypothetical protein FNV43_RR00060 [Rhamnella rubrinervis]|uniref:Uncharacterized protein n=1 Tax=Rhamnella rubrinervis TaxID=2594499 RepID=A0A8K0HNU7_9ROSA|nr:hypothetical protein FNV43_RR00060 [Rhamnella rubrinervis]